MKITIGNTIYYFTEEMLKNTEDGNIPAAVERAYLNGKAVKMVLHSYNWDATPQTRELIIYTPTVKVANKFIDQMKKAATKKHPTPKTSHPEYQAMINGEGTITVTVAKEYRIKGEWSSGKTTQLIRG